MLKFRNLKKVYKEASGGSLVALRNIGMNILQGEKIFIVGESGAGKSTMLKIIGLIVQDFEGSYNIHGKDVQEFSPSDRSVLRNELFGFVFQDYALIEDETVYNNVIIPLLYSKKLKRRERKKKYQE